MKKNLSPLRYPGGKNKLYNFIQQLIISNRSTSYIEPFAGGAAIALKLLLKNDVNRIFLNDYDVSIYSFWKSAIFYTEDFIQLIRDTPINMEIWYQQSEIQKRKLNFSLKKKKDCLTLGFSTFFLNRTNRSGILKAGVIGGKNQDGNYKMDCRFNKEDLIRRIELISGKRDSIFLYNLDAIDFIDKVIKKTRNSLVFFDPPYYKKGPALYTNFYKHENHIELANALRYKMNNRNWLLTYDTAPEIKEIYKSLNLNSIEYYLNYSISNPKVGREFMYFSKKLNVENYKDFLRVTEND